VLLIGHTKLSSKIVLKKVEGERMQCFYYGLFFSITLFSGLSSSSEKVSELPYDSVSSVAAVESFCHQFGTQSYYLKKMSQVYAFGGEQYMLPDHCKLLPFFTISSAIIQKYLFSSMRRRLKLTDLWAALKLAAQHY
jgi:hypothetical protein